MNPTISRREKIFSELCALLANQRRELVFVCLGSDLLTGDSLGPLVGQFLTSKYNLGCFVYGTLQSPVTAKNVSQTCAFISRHHAHACVIAVDAALGKKEEIGAVRVLSRGLAPSAALGKSLPPVGEIGIAAIVNTLGSAGFLSTRLGLVWQLAEDIAHAIYQSVYNLRECQYYNALTK